MKLDEQEAEVTRSGVCRWHKEYADWRNICGKHASLLVLREPDEIPLCAGHLHTFLALYGPHPVVALLQGQQSLGVSGLTLEDRARWLDSLVKAG